MIDVTLELGWGGRVSAHGGGMPLEGVDVLLDGVSAGKTDARGLVVLSAASPPTRVDLVLEGYEFASGDYDPGSGQLTGSYGTHDVTFRSPQ